MKKIFTTIGMAILSLFALAQIPQGFSYQGVACNMDGIELRNQYLQVRATILRDFIGDDIPEWIETHQLQTDPFGLFTLTIGKGIITEWQVINMK